MRPRFGPGFALAMMALMLAGCASQPIQRVQDFGSGDARIELQNTAFFPNEQRASAAAALAMLLYTDGLTQVGPAQIAPLLSAKATEPELRPELVSAAQNFDRLAFVITPTLATIFTELHAGRPVLILQKLDSWRYSVVVGVEPSSNRLILRSGNEGRVYQAVDVFLSGWRAGDNWAAVVITADKVPASATPESWIAVSEAASRAGKPLLAEKTAEAAVARWPGTVLPWVALGNVRYAADHYLEAQSAYLEALKLKPENPVVRNNLALVLLDRHCIDLAEQQLAKALAGETDPVLRAAYAKTGEKIRQYSGASIYCPPPDDAAAPIEYEIAPLNPEKPRAPRARPKPPPKPTS